MAIKIIKKSIRKRNPEKEDFHELILKIATINNLLYLDYKNNSYQYLVTNKIPNLEIDLKDLLKIILKIRSSSLETLEYGSLPEIGKYELSGLGNLIQGNSIYDMSKISNYLKKIVLVLTEFKKNQFVVSDKNYKLMKKEIFDLYDEIESYFVDERVSWWK